MDKEFIATLTKDEEDGEVSYNFSMAILDFDLPMIFPAMKVLIDDS